MGDVSFWRWRGVLGCIHVCMWEEDNMGFMHACSRKYSLPNHIFQCCLNVGQGVCVCWRWWYVFVCGGRGGTKCVCTLGVMVCLCVGGWGGGEGKGGVCSNSPWSHLSAVLRHGTWCVSVHAYVLYVRREAHYSGVKTYINGEWKQTEMGWSLQRFMGIHLYQCTIFGTEACQDFPIVWTVSHRGMTKTQSAVE